MPNYQPQSTAAMYSFDKGNRSVSIDSAIVPAILTTADKVRLCRIPAGTRVDRVVIRNPDMDTHATVPTLVVNIGFSNVDGTALALATAVAAASAAWQAPGTTTYELMPPVILEKDAFLEVVPTVGAATAGTGTVHGKIEGEILGAK